MRQPNDQHWFTVNRDFSPFDIDPVIDLDLFIDIDMIITFDWCWFWPNYTTSQWMDYRFSTAQINTSAIRREMHWKRNITLHTERL